MITLLIIVIVLLIILGMIAMACFITEDFYDKSLTLRAWLSIIFWPIAILIAIGLYIHQISKSAIEGRRTK